MSAKKQFSLVSGTLLLILGFVSFTPEARAFVYDYIGDIAFSSDTIQINGVKKERPFISFDLNRFPENDNIGFRFRIRKVQ